MHTVTSSRRRLRPLFLVVVAALVGVAVVATPGIEAQAEDGVALRTITADAPVCSVQTGVAFDGDRLLLSCWEEDTLWAVSPEDGSRVATIEVTGTTGIGALAWDREREQLWACDASTEAVKLVTITSDTTATADTVFTPTGGCVDGLAYDAVDDTLFTSGDVADTIYHWGSDGELLDSRDVSSSLGDCGSSGIEIGGGDLFLANNGCSEIYRVENEQAATPTLFASYPERLEDLACDDLTFRDQDTAAIWTQDAYDRVLNAFELDIGDCGFGGATPVEDFVVVAFGDSYQSGEGAANVHDDTDDYLSLGYENGENLPGRPGGQEDTYTPQAGGGNACHRALDNYAKLNRDLYEPDAVVTLVDVTCSGAQIEPAGKPAILGHVTDGSVDVVVGSQLRQAEDALADAGFTLDDVDLVTVGMGGNDAGFGTLVQTCVAPSLARKLLDAYPDVPNDVAVARSALDVFNSFNCHRAAQAFDVDLDAPIAALGALETAAQRELLSQFPNARVLQVDYPDIVPRGDELPSYCGGLHESDYGFLADKVRAINDQIRDAVSTVGGRLELVELQSALGSRALCPGAGGTALAIGLEEDNVDDEIDRLLNLDGDGDAEARGLLDQLVEDYRAHRNCVIRDRTPFRSCDTDATWTALTGTVEDILDHLEENLETVILPNIVDPGSDEDSGILFDRSRGLFHPSADGFEVIACNVRAAYADASAGGCLSNPSQVFTLGGEDAGWSPFGVTIGDVIDAILNGFAANSPVIITFYSDEVQVGTVTTDANGAIDVDVEVPDLPPGVHRLQFEGVAANGAEIVQEARVAVPGDPVPGESYGVYLCCFDTPDGSRDVVAVSYLGYEVELVTDPDGGVLVEIPVPETYDGSSLDVTATSLSTGATVVEDVVEPRVDVSTLRLAGDDRYATAVEVSKDQFEDGSAPAVVLARGDEFADALAGMAFAAEVGGPLLLTPPDGLPDTVAAELGRVLGADGTVHLLGGPVALSAAVEDAVRDLGHDTDRIAGPDRYATAVAVADRLPEPTVAFVARGQAFPDALAAGAAATARGGVVLLTPDDAPVDVTTEWLDAHDDVRAVAVGGPAARAYPELEELAGLDRQASAVAVADEFFDVPAVVGLARSDTFADALTGGLHAGRLGGPILLTPTTALADATATWLCANGAGTRNLAVYGGPVAVDGATMATAVGRLDGQGC